MSYTTSPKSKLASLLVAAVIAVGIQGGVLMGFDQMANAAQASAANGQIWTNVKAPTFITLCAPQPKHES